MKITTLLVALLLSLTACSGQADDQTGGAAQPSQAPSQTPSETPSEVSGETTTPTATPSTSEVSPLEDGPITPGRHSFQLISTCDARAGCPTKKEPPLPTVKITVPDGWDAATDVVSIFPAVGRDTTSRNDPALAMGWTNFWLSLNSQPCSHTEHQKPDIAVGPTVQDFVDAVAAHPLLKVSKPVPVKLGKYSGQYFSLFGPKDISACTEWRPWEPAPYLQGPENQWDIWAIDVEGVRTVIMVEYFPETPEDIKAELHEMAESVRFTPGTA
jgi:hypothetical protein